MQLGMIGLGRIAANLARRLMRDGLEVVVVDVNAGSVRRLEWEGAVGARSLEEFVAKVAEVWRRGSVIASWLLDLRASALGKSPDLGGYSGRISDSGGGRWTVAAALDAGVPANVLTAALYERFSLRWDAGFGGQLLSAMRNEFGGPVEKAAAGA